MKTRARIATATALLGAVVLVAFVTIGADALRERWLVWRLGSCDDEDRWAILRALEPLGSTTAEERYIALLRGGSWPERERAAHGLARIGSRRAVESLLGLTHPGLDPVAENPYDLGFRTDGLLELGLRRPEVAEALATALRERLAPVGADESVETPNPGVVRIAAPFGHEQRVAAAAFAIETIRRAVEEGAPRTRQEVERIVAGGATAALRRNALVCSWLLSDTGALDELHGVTRP